VILVVLLIILHCCSFTISRIFYFSKWIHSCFYSKFNSFF